MKISTVEALEIVWSFVWRNIILMFLSIPVGFVIGYAGGLMGYEPQVIGVVSFCITFPIGIAVSVYIVKRVFEIYFEKFLKVNT